MKEIIELLIYHNENFPLWQIQDVYKLLYQNEFGSEHMLGSFEETYKYLENEYSSIEVREEASFVPIGSGLVRLNLHSAKTKGWPMRVINRLFHMVALGSSGSLDSFQQKLTIVRALCQSEMLPFATTEWDSFITEQEHNSFPAMRHSATYRESYQPAYRLACEGDMYLLPFLIKLEDLYLQLGKKCLAIDGRSTAGKTSLAARLAGVYDAAVVHMDDFFLPRSMRTKDRLDEPGGNVHYERFLEEVAPSLTKEIVFNYHRFDHQLMDLGEVIVVPNKKLTIVEGAYAMRPELRQYYDLTLFLDIAPEEQLQRLKLRCGENSPRLAMFQQLWIPLEEKYISAYDLTRQCDLVLRQLS